VRVTEGCNTVIAQDDDTINISERWPEITPTVPLGTSALNAKNALPIAKENKSCPDPQIASSLAAKHCFGQPLQGSVP
jgi:hypothetical protein